MTTPEDVARIRAYVLAHPEMSPKEQYANLSPPFGLSEFYGIRDNHKFHDPTYTPPQKGVWRQHEIVDGKMVCRMCGEPRRLDQFGFNRARLRDGTVKVYRKKVCRSCYRAEVDRCHGVKVETYAAPRAQRPASIDCKFTCPTCGMGAETEAEAEACCQRAKEA